MKQGSGSNNFINAGMFGAYKTGLDNKVKNENVGGGITPTVTSNTNTSTIANTEEYKNLVNQKRSALSTANAANRVAMKYADNAALAQGYATQGAALQNVANIQNAYQNQVGGINQQFQQQLGELKDTKSAESLENFYQMIQNGVANGTLTEETGNKLLQESSGMLSGNDSNLAKTYLQQALLGQEASAKDKAFTDSYNQFNSMLEIYSQDGIDQDEVSKLQEYLPNMSESDKNYATKLIEAYQKQYPAQTPESQQQVSESENSYTGLTNPINNKQYDVMFGNGTSINKNFTVTVDGKTYEVELGNQVDAYLSNSTKQKIFAQFKDKKVGDIWEYSNGNKTVLLVKTGNTANDIRVIEKAGVSRDDYEALANALGYNRSKYIESDSSSNGGGGQRGGR